VIGSIWPRIQFLYSNIDRLNLNYVIKVEEEIKLLWIGFIRPIKRVTWLSLIIVVPKKNGSMHGLS
jgi:hypothetical protein